VSPYCCLLCLFYEIKSLNESLNFLANLKDFVFLVVRLNGFITLLYSNEFNLPSYIFNRDHLEIELFSIPV